MDQHSLSLKFFKKNKSQSKKQSLFLKRKRIYKKRSQQHLNIKNQQWSKFLSSQGQILMEGLFFVICILSFLSALHFFQSLARKEIQEERLIKQKSRKIKKAPWFKPTSYKEQP